MCVSVAIGGIPTQMIDISIYQRAGKQDIAVKAMIGYTNGWLWTNRKLQNLQCNLMRTLDKALSRNAAEIISSGNQHENEMRRKNVSIKLTTIKCQLKIIGNIESLLKIQKEKI